MMERNSGPTDPASPDSGENLRRSRRRLLQGGAPLLMTLMSRPVLGQTQCFSCSAFSSMRTSQHGPLVSCDGKTPDYWRAKENQDKWPYGYYATTDGRLGVKATLFATLFPSSPYPPPITCLQVLDLDPAPPHDLARHMVASALNIMSGKVPVLTLPELQTIWLEYRNSGGGLIGKFEPTAGVKWGYDEILLYLRHTMGYAVPL